MALLVEFSESEVGLERATSTEACRYANGEQAALAVLPKRRCIFVRVRGGHTSTLLAAAHTPKEYGAHLGGALMIPVKACATLRYVAGPKRA